MKQLMGFILLLVAFNTQATMQLIAHRGASGYLPEHTLEAATLAFAQSPDYIEQDVVLSKDGQPVVLHDIHLETVTDVEQKYPDRARKDGRFYVIDFTLAELKTLRVHERQTEAQKPVFADRYQGDQAGFTVATLQEHIELISQLNREFSQHIGFYTEIKSPAWHRKQGKDVSQIVLDTFRQANLLNENSPVIIQCFDFAEVQRLRNELDYQGTLVLLTGPNDWGESATDFDKILTPEGIKKVAAVADGIGPWLGQLVDMQALSQGKVSPLPWFVAAKESGLMIHPYTVRADALPKGMSLPQLIGLLDKALKVDAVFTDQVPAVKQALTAAPNN